MNILKFNLCRNGKFILVSITIAELFRLLSAKFKSTKLGICLGDSHLIPA